MTDFYTQVAATLQDIERRLGVLERAEHVGQPNVIQLEFANGGSVLTTGVKHYWIVPFNCTLYRWDLFSTLSGSIVIDVWKDSYANFPPTVADTIAGSEKPTLSSAIKNQDTNITTWTTALNIGDVLVFNIDSITTCTNVLLAIYVKRR